MNLNVNKDNLSNLTENISICKEKGHQYIWQEFEVEYNTNGIISNIPNAKRHVGMCIICGKMGYEDEYIQEKCFSKK